MRPASFATRTIRSYRVVQLGFIEHPSAEGSSSGVIVPMRFAILGNHPDGVAVARAVAASGRHQFTAWCGPRPADLPDIHVTQDLEEMLADPDIEAVVVAGRPGERLDQLRRVLQ